MLLCVCLSILLFGIDAQEFAKLFQSTSTTITSSTLFWEEIRDNKDIPSNAVKLTENSSSLYWCRILQNTIYVPGSVVEGRCLVPFFKVYNESKFDVLVSLNGSSRLLRTPWSFQHAITLGAVMSPSFFMAQHTTSDGDILAGYIDPKEVSIRAKYVQDNKVINKTVANILYEIEPIKYNLSRIVLKDVISENEEKMLYNFTMFNYEMQESTVKQSVSYEEIHEVFWGNVKGCIYNRLTNVRTPSESYQVNWGIMKRFKNSGQHDIEYDLPPSSYVNVTVYGVVKVIPDIRFDAILTSEYPDGVSAISRNVTGIHNSRRFIELRANFSHVVNIAENQPSPHHKPKSMVLIQSTTTTTTPHPPFGNEEPTAGTSGLFNPFWMWILVAVYLYGSCD